MGRSSRLVRQRPMEVRATEAYPHWKQSLVTWFWQQTVQIPWMTITCQLTFRIEAHTRPNSYLSGSSTQWLSLGQVASKRNPPQPLGCYHDSHCRMDQSRKNVLLTSDSPGSLFMLTPWAESPIPMYLRNKHTKKFWLATDYVSPFSHISW